MASTSKTKKTKGSSSRFVEILWSMVNNEDEIKKCGKHISWNESGTGIVIESRNELASHVLPTYFNTREFSSFHRQLTNYGFKKLQDVEGDEFVNENFIRGFPELRKNIIKKKPPDKHKKGSSARGESLKTHHPSQNSSTCTSLPHNPQDPAASEQLTAKRPQENEPFNQKLKKLRASEVRSTDPDSRTPLRSLGTASAVERVSDQANYSLQKEGESQELVIRNTEEIGHSKPGSQETRNGTVSSAPHSLLEELMDNGLMGYSTPEQNYLSNVSNATPMMQLNQSFHPGNTDMGGDLSKHDGFVPFPGPSDISSPTFLLDVSQQPLGVRAQVAQPMEIVNQSSHQDINSIARSNSKVSSDDSGQIVWSPSFDGYLENDALDSDPDWLLSLDFNGGDPSAVTPTPELTASSSYSSFDSIPSVASFNVGIQGQMNDDQNQKPEPLKALHPQVPHGNSSDSGLGSHSSSSGPQSTDMSENENNAVVDHAIIEIFPDVVGLRGAPSCEFPGLSERFPEVQSGYYTVEGVKEEFCWEKGDKDGKGDCIPPSTEEGEKTVIIWSLSREKMGEAKLLYVDRRKHKKEEHLKTYVRKVTQQIEDLAVSLRDQADQSEIDGTQHSEVFGSARKVQALRLLIHKAAKCGFQWDSFSLSESAIMMHDLKNAAINLEKITDRFARDIAPEGTESFDWSELFEIFDAPHEQGGAIEDESRQLEASEDNDSSYYGDVESLSCDSAADLTSDSEDDLSEMLSKETQETHSGLNESAVSLKENLNKNQMSDKTDTASKNHMLPFGNEGNFSRKEIAIRRREMPSKHILDKHCNFQVNIHFYREMINFPKMTSCRQPLISALLIVNTESVKRYLSTIHERWRIQLQLKQFSGITSMSSSSVLCQKVHLDAAEDTLSFSLTKPASKEKNTVGKDLVPPILRYFEVGQSLSKDEGAAVQWEAFGKSRSKASDVWVLTSTYRPKKKTLFVCVGDRQDFFPLEWFEDEDCELSTKCWKWCEYRDRLGERLMEVQEQSEFKESQQEPSPSDPLVTYMLPQINGNVIQFQECQCPAWLQAVLYHCGLDDDVRRTPPYALSEPMTSSILGSKLSDSNEGMKSMKSCILRSCWSNADEFKRPEFYFCPVDGAWVDDKPTGEMYFEKSFPSNEELHDPKEVRENISGEAMSSVSVNVNCAVCVEELTEFLSKQKSITTLTVDVNIPRCTMTGRAEKLAEALAKIPSLSTLTLNIKGRFDMVADLAYGLANSTSLTTLAVNFSRNCVEDCGHRPGGKAWFFLEFLEFLNPKRPVDLYNLAVGLARSTSLTTLTLRFNDFSDFHGAYVFGVSPRHWRLKCAANSVEALVKSESLTTLNLSVGCCTVMRVFFSSSYVFLDGDWAHELANCLEKRMQLPILTVDTSISDNVIEGWAYYMENGFTSLSTLSLNIHNAVYIKEGLSHTLMNSLVKSMSLTSLTLNLDVPQHGSLVFLPGMYFDYLRKDMAELRMMNIIAHDLANSLAKSTSLTTFTLTVSNLVGLSTAWTQILAEGLSKSTSLRELALTLNVNNCFRDVKTLECITGMAESTVLSTTFTLNVDNRTLIKARFSPRCVCLEGDRALDVLNSLAANTSLTSLELHISNPGSMEQSRVHDLANSLAMTSLTTLTLNIANPGNMKEGWVYDLANGLPKSTSLTTLTLNVNNPGNIRDGWANPLTNILSKSPLLTTLEINIKNPSNMSEDWANSLSNGLGKSTTLTTLTLRIHNPGNMREGWANSLMNGLAKSTSLTALTLSISNPGYISKGWEHDLTNGLAKSTSITAFTLDFTGNGNRFWIYNLANGLAKSTSVTSLTLDIKNTGNMTRFWVCHLANGLAKSTSLTSLTLRMDNPPNVRWTDYLAQGLAKSSSLTTLTLNINNYWFRNVRSRAWFHDLANGLAESTSMTTIVLNISNPANASNRWTHIQTDNMTKCTSPSTPVISIKFPKDMSKRCEVDVLESVVESKSLTYSTLNVNSQNDMLELWEVEVTEGLAESNSSTCFTLNVDNQKDQPERWGVGLGEALAKSNSLTSFTINVNNQGEMSKFWGLGLAEGLAKSNSLTSFTINGNNQGDIPELWGVGLAEGLAKSNSLTSFIINVNNQGDMTELWGVGLAEGLAKSNSLASFSLNVNNQGDMSELWAVGLAEGLAKSNSLASFSLNLNNQGDMSELWAVGLAEGLAKSNSFRSFSSNFNNQVDMSELWGLGLAKSNSL